MSEFHHAGGPGSHTSAMPNATRSVADEARGAARDVADEARATGATVKSEVGGLAHSLKEGLAAQAEQQKNAIADRIGRVADRVQSTAGDLQGDEAWLAGWMERGALELGGLADEIRGNDVAGLVGSAEVFARRQPAIFVGAAVALGFAVSRVLMGGGNDSRRSPSYPVAPDRYPAAPSQPTPAAAMDHRSGSMAGGELRSGL